MSDQNTAPLESETTARASGGVTPGDTALLDPQESAPARSTVNVLRLIEEMMLVDQIGVTEAARRMGIPVATAYRLLKALEYCGFAEQLPNSKRYRLSLKLFEIGCRVASQVTIRDLAGVEMERLARQTRLAVNLGVLVGADLLYLDKIQTDDTLVLNLPAGMRAPAHCTAMGKVMLAYAGDDPRAIIGEEPWARSTEFSISTAEELDAELATVRRAGWAVDRQELSLGIWCVAAPIIDARGHVHGAISVSALRANFEQSELDDLGLHTLATARRIAARIGSFGTS